MNSSLSHGLTIRANVGNEDAAWTSWEGEAAELRTLFRHNIMVEFDDAVDSLMNTY
jgi:hypothetical protein